MGFMVAGRVWTNPGIICICACSFWFNSPVPTSPAQISYCCLIQRWLINKDWVVVGFIPTSSHFKKNWLCSNNRNKTLGSFRYGYFLFTNQISTNFTIKFHRFQPHNTTAFKISALLPAHLQKHTFSDVEEIVEFFHPCLLTTRADVSGEYDRWCMKWKNAENLPACPVDARRDCDPDFYPLIHNYLKINCCLPTTTASAEKTFSTLKYLKNYLRSTTSEDRLNGLTRLYIHQDIAIDIDSVIDTFALKKRKCDFVI